LFTGWEEHGVFQRLFAELPTASPTINRLDPSFTVRFPDQQEINITTRTNHFYAQVSQVFPECAPAAIAFFEGLSHPASDSRPVAASLNECSHRFRRFLDVQLQTFTGMSSETCPYNRAAVVLNPRRQFFGLSGGGQALADSLASAFRASGGTLRLNAPVLRLAYDSQGLPTGIDLLNGERVKATRAIISNLSVWDTFGKLVGMSRTPPSISAELKKIHGWGAYLMFLELDAGVLERLSSRRLMVLNGWQDNEPFDPETGQFIFTAQEGAKPLATVCVPTRAEDWFSFHEDHSAHETQDQGMLESLWTRLHAAMPELGAGVEIIETATPQTFYETTRRRFGLVGPVTGGSNQPNLLHPYPNLFLVGDTVSNEFGAAGAAESAYLAAQQIA
jgi:phytoene dehydrogenase-like protein